MNTQPSIKEKIFFLCMRMLIIDDNPDTTKMLSEFFNYKGFQVTVENDPWEGLKHIQTEKFDVILLDLMIPQFSGKQIIATLATNEILQNQNIYIYSGCLTCEVEIKDLLRRDGVSGCLKKPMDLNEILKTITNGSSLEETKLTRFN